LEKVACGAFSDILPAAKGVTARPASDLEGAAAGVLFDDLEFRAPGGVKAMGTTTSWGGAMLGFFARAIIVALGLWLATIWVQGVYIDDPATLLLAGISLGVVNAVIRPIAIVLTLPMTVLSLGLFLLVINAGMLSLVAWMLPGMHIAGFSSAFWAALLVSLVSMVGSWLVGPKGKIEVIVKRR
jgi:putative membrane protein